MPLQNGGTTAKERLYARTTSSNKNNSGSTAKERILSKAVMAEVAREETQRQESSRERVNLPSPRELMSLGGQTLTAGTVRDVPDAIQEMRERIMEQEMERQEAAKRRALYYVEPEKTAAQLAGMQLDPADFAKVGGSAMTSGTAQSAADKLGTYKRSTQPKTSGPVKLDFMGVSAERDARLELLNENLRKLEEQRKRQEAQAAPNQEERQAQQEAFWRGRALSTGYSPNSSVQMSTRQQEAAKKAGALKNQERELSQYIKWLEGQGIQDRAENAYTRQDVQDGLVTDAMGQVSDGKNQMTKIMVEAIQARELGENPTGSDAPETLSMLRMADAMTDRQKDTMLALAGKGDWDGATRYLNSIADQINQKAAEQEYNDMKGWEKGLYWIPAGLEQFGTGISQLGHSEVRSPSVTRRVSQMVQQDAYDTHPALGFAYDMGTSISNMTPSILLSMVAGPALGAAGLSASTAGAVAGGIGSAALGASAGGNAYAEKRRQGYSEDEAAAYATLVGISEAGLQYVLGGISKLGATPAAKAASQVVKIDNALGQAALRLGANMLSEGTEEGLQAILEPAFATLILDEKYQVSPQEVVTSFLMGALTAGLLEGPGAVRAGRIGQEAARNGGFDTGIDGYLGESGVDYFRGVKNLEETHTGMEILKDYYSLDQEGADVETVNDVVRQYVMRSAWYEGRDQARRATGQTTTEETQQAETGQDWTQVDTVGQDAAKEAQAVEPEGLRLGAMWEDTKNQAAREAQDAVKTASLVQEARETVQAAREPQNAELEVLRLGAVLEGTQQQAQSRTGQFQMVQPAQTDQPEGLTLGAMWTDNNPSNTQNQSEGAGVNGRATEAAATAGAGVLDGGQGRVYGEGPGQQAGILESRPAAAAQASDQSRRAAERLDRAANLRGQEVSSRQLGLSRGTDTANVLVVPQEMWDAEMTQVAQEVQARTGATVTYVLGDVEVSHTDGSVGTVRGVQMPGRVIVRADHPRVSVEQIAKHEAFHELASRDVEMVRTAEERIKARYDADEFNAVVATYIQKLQGVIDIPANGTAEQINEASYRIMEEICADAYAGINAFGVQASQYQETVRELVQEREAAAPSRETAKATERTTGPTSDSEVAQQQQDIEDVRNRLRDAYAAGEISEAEYDAAMDAVWEQAGVEGEDLLVAWDRMDEDDGWGKFSKDDEEILIETEVGDDGNIYLPGGPVPEAVKRRRAAEQSTNTVERNGRATEQSAPDPNLTERYSSGDNQENIVDTLPKKAQNYLSRAERAMVRNLGELLSVPTAAQREYLQDTVREISEEYLRDGRVSQETADRLFEDAYAQGVMVQETLMDEYRDLYDRLRSTDLVLAKEYTGDIPDFEAFRKKYLGRLKISTKGRTNIDQVYMELADSWPQFFGPEHTHPSDQLEHIAKVMDDFRRVEMSLDDYYGRDGEFKRWAKHDFEVAVTDMMGELRNVKRYADERAAAKAAQQEAVPTTQTEVEEAWRNLKNARRTYEKVNAKNLLTNDDRVAVGRLLRGEIQLKHLDPNEVNVKGVKAVYEARVEYERLAKGIKTWNRSRKEQLMTQADHLLETANDWKDKPAGILYSRETMERNVRDIVKDRALAEEIISTYFTPVHQGAAAANRTKNTYRERVRELGLSRKVAKGNLVSEAHAVQLLGEAEDNIRVLEQSKGQVKVRDGKTLEEWNGVVTDLWKQNPNLDESKIRNAVQEFRTIYDELFQQMNEVRVRNGYEPVNYRQGYFPHFQPGNGDGIMAAFGRALGISTEVTALPTTINGLTHTFRPGIRWFGNAQERLGFNTAYDAVEGFDRYIEGVADVIHQTDNIQRLRALASQIRYRTGDEGIRRQVDAVRENTTLAEQDKESRIKEIYENGRFALNNFVVELEEYTNLLANKKSRADRNMEQALGRRSYNLVKALESRVAANMVAVNPASWLTNFIPLTQGRALLDRGMLLHGMWDTLRAYKGDDGFVDTSSFLTNRRGSDPLVKTWAQKASSTMSKPMEFIDQFTADSLVRAKYRQNLAHGMSEDAAMVEADAWTAGVMADRSKGSMPTLFERKNPLTKVFTQFQLEVNNQLSYLFKDMPRDTRDKGLHVLAATLIKFALGAFLYNEVYEYVIGRRPALDPLGILNDTVGDLTGWELPNLVTLGTEAAAGELTAEDFRTEQGDLYDAAEGLAGNVAENLPFIGGVLGGGRVPVSNALPDWQMLAKALMGENWSPEKRASTIASELGNPLTYLFPPFGGGQLKKIYQGIKAAMDGGKYSTNSDGEEILQYPMFMDSPGEAVSSVSRALLFGTTSLPTGQAWIEGGFKSMTAEQTAAYKGLLEAGVQGKEAYDLILELRGATKTETTSKAQQQRDILSASELDEDSKSIAYYAMLATDREREIMDIMEGEGADMGKVTQALMAIKNQGAGTREEVEQAIRSVTGLNNTVRGMLWQLQDKSWKTKDNPFSEFAGYKVKTNYEDPEPLSLPTLDD